MVTTLASRHSSVGRASAAASLVLLLAAFSANAQDWNTNFGGRSERSGLSTAIGPTSPGAAWSQSLTAAFGFPPFIESNRVVSSRLGSLADPPSTTWIVAHNIRNGTQLWSVQLPRNFSDSWSSTVVGMRDGQVYASRASNGNNSEYMYALNATTGAIVWRSQALVSEASAVEGVAFASNGDLIHGSFQSLIRINRLNGQTVWQTPRLCPATGGCAAAVLGSRVYAFDVLSSAGSLKIVVSVFDVNTGQKLYSSPTLSQGSFAINQIGLFVGPDATVYAPLDPNNGQLLVALRDTGTALVERWRVPMGATAFASFGVGPDGSVFSYSMSQQVVRLDPATGAVRNTSATIPSDSAFAPHLAVDSNGRVYVGSGAVSGVLTILDTNLATLWSTSVNNIGYGGPALGGNGGPPLAGANYLVVTGGGTLFVAYVQPISPGPCHGTSGDCNPSGPGGN